MKRLLPLAISAFLLGTMVDLPKMAFAQDGTQEGYSEESAPPPSDPPPSSDEVPTDTPSQLENPSGEPPEPPEENPDANVDRPDEGTGSTESENKSFVCGKCGFTSDATGDCPACNMPLTEEVKDAAGPADPVDSNSTGEPPSDSPSDSPEPPSDSSEPPSDAPTGESEPQNSGESDPPPADSSSEPSNSDS